MTAPSSTERPGYRRVLAPRPPTECGMRDGRERVTGALDYTIDVSLPGMLHAAVLRSTAAHARIARIDVSQVETMPGVHAVLTGRRLAQYGGITPRFGTVFRDQPVLAIDKVHHVGEPVVAVAAETLDQARRALDHAVVEYEELPAVLSLDDALAPDAALVHESPPELLSTFTDIITDRSLGGNVCTSFHLRHGELSRGMAAADHVFEDVFTSPPVQHVPLETHCCVARVDGPQITLWAGSQIPYLLRQQVADTFQRPVSSVRVHVPNLGGGYGAKCYPAIEPLTVALALFARRPVRLHLTREEEFLTATKHGVRIAVTTGMRSDGVITARKVTAHYDTGAFAVIGPRLIKNSAIGTAGPYRNPDIEIDSHAIYTNYPPASSFRGYGISQAAWAHESQMDLAAHELGLDPYEIRKRNLLAEGDHFATGEELDDLHFDALLDTVAERIGWFDHPRGEPAPEQTPQQDRRVRGRGLGVIIKSTVTPSTSTATARLNEDGSLQVLSSSVEMGQGIKTALARMAAEQMEIPVERVRITDVDTDVTPYDQQTSSSRTTHAMGVALEAALEQIREQLIEAGADLLDTPSGGVVLEAGEVREKGAAGGLAFGEVVRRSGAGNFMGSGRFQSTGGLDSQTGQGVASVHWHQAAGAAEVEVDLDTGRTTILHYEASVYAGRVINPITSELQTEGNVAFGLGQALYEEMLYDNGQLQNGNLADYMIPAMDDMPAELGLSVLERDDAPEIHGIGEIALPPVMPAVANAVFDATGVRITDLPVTAEKVLRALRACAEDPERPGGER